MRKRTLIGFAVLFFSLGWLSPFATAGDPAGPDGSTPPNTVLYNVSQNSVQVRWEPIAGATRYELSHGTDPDASNRGRMFVSGTTQTLQTLMSNTIYHVKVRAVVGGRAGAWSQLKEFSTQIPPISELKADDVRDTTVHLVWSGMFSDLPDTLYEISYGTDRDATSDGIQSTAKNFLTLHSLRPETTYFVKLRARNAKTIGPWNTPQSVTTLPYSPGLAPMGLIIQNGERGSVALTWRAVAEASSYDLAYGNEPAAENMGIVPVYENRFTVQLAPNTRYYFKIRAIVKGNNGPWCRIQSYLTLPDAPRGLLVASRTSNSTIMNWKSLAGGNIARYYHISWGTNPDATNLGVTVTANAEFVLDGLKADHLYYAKVRTLNATGASLWSEPLSFNTLSAGLTRLNVFEIRHTTAKIEWPPVENAVAYEVAIGTDEEAGNLPSLEWIRSPLELKNLKSNQAYALRIRPIFAEHQTGPWSNVVNFTTFQIPPMPQGLTVTETGGTYVRLTWTAAVGISTYEVLSSTDEIAETGRSQILNRNEAYFARLKENSNYFFKIRAVNLGGPGAWSPATPVVTLPDLSPRGLTVSGITPDEALLRWESIPGNAAATYEIRFAPTAHAWRVIPNFPGQTMSLEKLEADSLYRVQVRVKNTTGFGPWCAENNFRTLPLPPETAPVSLHAENVTDISARVLWKPMTRVDGYLFSMGMDTDAANQGVEKLSQTDFMLKGLMPETNYFVKVKAFNQTGEGPWSEVLLVTTRLSAPVSAPEAVVVSDVTPLSFNLTWKASDEARFYEVSLATDKRGATEVISSSQAPAFLFTDLKSETTYYVKVRKANRGGGGPWSQIRVVTTPPRQH